MRGWIDFSDGSYSFVPDFDGDSPRPDIITISWWQWSLLRVLWYFVRIERRWLRRLDNEQREQP